MSRSIFGVLVKQHIASYSDSHTGFVNFLQYSFALVDASMDGSLRERRNVSASIKTGDVKLMFGKVFSKTKGLVAWKAYVTEKFQL